MKLVFWSKLIVKEEVIKITKYKVRPSKEKYAFLLGGARKGSICFELGKE